VPQRPATSLAFRLLATAEPPGRVPAQGSPQETLSLPCWQRFDVLQDLSETHDVMVPPKRTSRSRRMANHEPVRSRLSNVRGWLSDNDPFLATVDGIVAARAKHRPREALSRPRVNHTNPPNEYARNSWKTPRSHEGVSLA
jgi:hypothetical protein